ncbi:MAG: phosphate acyltransferase PlsX [Gammaproteobacteria bacterium]|nr:phosphate acyltransferase PlsX [Gammaproteobacteria bacterium]
MLITIALDAMGGDHGPSEIVPAALYMLKRQENLALILVGDQATIERELKEHGQTATQTDRLSIHHASEVIAMDEPPASALRNKKDASMRVAINLVKEGRAAAWVSAGNTGALMAIARFVLKTLEGIDRPAIIGLLPTVDSQARVRMLDLGANVDSTVDHLFQFAVMGGVVSEAVDGISRPKIAVLSNGKEEIKGNELVKEVAKRLAATPQLHYVGYVEADEIFSGQVDVVICDGFVGNVALKACEGVAKFIASSMKQEFQRNLLTKLAGAVAYPVLRSLVRRIDPARYNGATLIGLQGIVVKSHGSAKAMSFANAIHEAMVEVRKEVPQRICKQVAQFFQTR